MCLPEQGLLCPQNLHCRGWVLGQVRQTACVRDQPSTHLWRKQASTNNMTKWQVSYWRETRTEITRDTVKHILTMFSSDKA